MIQRKDKFHGSLGWPNFFWDTERKILGTLCAGQGLWVRLATEIFSLMYIRLDSTELYWCRIIFAVAGNIGKGQGSPAKAMRRLRAGILVSGMLLKGVLAGSPDADLSL